MLSEANIHFFPGHLDFRIVSVWWSGITNTYQTVTHILTQIAGAMRRQGLSAEEMAPSLLTVNVGRCQPPLRCGRLLGAWLGMTKPVAEM